MRYGRKRPRIPRIIAAFAIVGSVLLLLTARCIERAIEPNVELQAEYAARSMAERVIAEEVADYMSESGFTYGDFSAIVYDESGGVTSVEAISVNINKAQAELTERISRRLGKGNEDVVLIPIGSLFGRHLLTGRGPRIRVRTGAVGNVSVELKSSFESAGANQSRHRIYADISVKIVSSVPKNHYETEEHFELLLAETVIVGDVPGYTSHF